MRYNNRAGGVALAVVAAGLFAALPILESGAHSDGEEGHHGVNGKCSGGNACKGQSACKTASSQCAGQNACKGKGFTITTEENCKAQGGSFESM